MAYQREDGGSYQPWLPTGTKGYIVTESLETVRQLNKSSSAFY